MKARIATLQQLLPRLTDKIMLGGGDLGLIGAAGGGVSSAALSTTPIAKLPTVDAAWDLPIPAELTQRQVQLMLQEANRTQCSAFSNSGAYWAALLNSNAVKLEEEDDDVNNDKDGEESKANSCGDGWFKLISYVIFLLFLLFYHFET